MAQWWLQCVLSTRYKSNNSLTQPWEWHFSAANWVSPVWHRHTTRAFIELVKWSLVLSFCRPLPFLPAHCCVGRSEEKYDARQRALFMPRPQTCRLLTLRSGSCWSWKTFFQLSDRCLSIMTGWGVGIHGSWIPCCDRPSGHVAICNGANQCEEAEQLLLSSRSSPLFSVIKLWKFEMLWQLRTTAVLSERPKSLSSRKRRC